MRASAFLLSLLSLIACERTTPLRSAKAPLAAGADAAPRPAVTVPPAPSSARATALAAPPAGPEPAVKRREAELRTFDLRDVSTKYDFRLALLPPAPNAHPDDMPGPGGAITVFAKGQTIPIHQLIVEDIGPAAFEEGYQPELTVGDFDFDGQEDFALHVADGGPYGSPTYAVFVHRAKGDPFVLSQALTDLTRESMGFFDVDEKKRRIRTASKSGCCIHWQSEYVIVGGEPRRIRTETQDALNYGCRMTIETLSRDGTWKRVTHPCPSQEE